MRSARHAGIEAIGLEHAACDVTDRAAVEASLAPMAPDDVVVNTAAFHRTDECETHPERAFSVNAVGAGHVAAVAAKRGAATVFLSSDFVFDGGKRSPYLESDAPRPINVYGVSKLAGEMLVAQTDPRSYVVRISSVFGPAGSSGKGGNFVESMIAKARAGERIAVVDDLVMAPTSARDAADLLIALLARRAPFGTYHLANAGACSWHEFATAILDMVGATAKPEAIAARDEPGKAKRPRSSVLASERLGPLGLSARPWREALEAYLAERGHAADVRR